MSGKLCGMNTTGHVLVALVMVVGLLGVAIPVLPGLLLVLAGGLWWTMADGASTGHWIVFGVMAALMLAGTAAKYIIPAKRTSQAGASKRSMVFAVLLGVAGLFVIPVVGAPIGFVLGIYLAERARLGAHAPAWSSTRAALRGVGLSMLIEFCAGVAMIAVWLIGAFIV